MFNSLIYCILRRIHITIVNEAGTHNHNKNVKPKIKEKKKEKFKFIGFK